MNKYQFKSGSHLTGNAQAVGEELETIRQRDGGLVPKAVVIQARPESNPLHPHFEWNDLKAADLYREDQARHIIRCVEVVYTAPEKKEQKEVRAFVAVQKPDGDRIYESTAVAMSDTEYRRQVLQSAFRELGQVRAKYASLQELADVFAAMDKVEQEWREPTAA